MSYYEYASQQQSVSAELPVHALPTGNLFGYTSDDHGECFFSDTGEGQYVVAFYPALEGTGLAPGERMTFNSSMTEFNNDTSIRISLTLSGLPSHTDRLQMAASNFVHPRTSSSPDTINGDDSFRSRMYQAAPHLIHNTASHYETMSLDDFAQFRHWMDNRGFAAAARMTEYDNRMASLFFESCDGMTYIHTGDSIPVLVDNGLFSSPISPRSHRPLERAPRLVCYACGWELLDMKKRPLVEHDRVGKRCSHLRQLRRHSQSPSSLRRERDRSPP